MPVLTSRPQAAQFLGDEVRRFDFAVAELGIRVQVTPPLDHMRLDRFGGDIHRGHIRERNQPEDSVPGRRLFF